ncbi:MAG: hypothetical protein ACOYMR_10175 [Ilumatobacteraceae bacterium]
MASSSSAKKVAKLASRGKGKKVRFQSGTTFPVVVAIASVLMIVLVAYSRATVPGIETGPPQPTDNWSMAYGIRICDTWLPDLTGTEAELELDASTGDPSKVVNGPNADGIIHYHPQEGGATGRKARLGVFLDIYDVKLSDTKLELPASQVGEGEDRVWDTKSFKCNGKETQIRVRVWNDYTVGDFVDNVTNFRNLRFLNNGMVFSIAVVPKGDDIPQPESTGTLTDLGVIGAGTVTTTTPAGGSTDSTTPTSDSTGSSDPGTTSPASETSATPTT